MPVLRDVLRTTLTGDTALMAILTGGVFDAAALPRDGGGVDYAPRETDGVRIKPHCVIRMGESTPIAIRGVLPELQTVEFHLYQDKGYDQIDSARARMKFLLEEKYVTADETEMAELMLIFVSRDLTADELGGASQRVLRYAVTTVFKRS